MCVVSCFTVFPAIFRKQIPLIETVYFVLLICTEQCMTEWLPTDFRLAHIFHLVFKAPHDWVYNLFFSLCSALHQPTEHFKVNFSCSVLMDIPHHLKRNSPTIYSSLLYLYPPSSQSLLILPSSVSALFLQDYFYWPSPSLQATIVKCCPRTLIFSFVKPYCTFQEGIDYDGLIYWKKNFSKTCVQHVINNLC